jgi:NOL1/NOP2/fmu family ribosome biogenesis protein
MVLEKIDRKYGRQGLDNPYVKRIFPMDKGEGHFVARLRKTTGSIRSLPVLKSDRIDSVTEAFLKEQLMDLPANYMIRDGHIYAMNHPFLMLKKIPVIRQGILLGERIKNRFEPAHAFYMNADWIDFYKHKIDVNISDMDKFMHGLELETPCSKGYTAVCMNGIPFGFGKSDGKHIKNKIPKGLRLTSNQHVLKMEVE